MSSIPSFGDWNVSNDFIDQGGEHVKVKHSNVNIKVNKYVNYNVNTMQVETLQIS